MSETYDYGERFQLKLLALAVRDPKFLTCYFDVFKSHFFSYRTMVQIARITSDHFTKYRKPPTKHDLLDLVAEHIQKYGAGEGMTPEMYIATIEHTFNEDIGDLDFVRDRAIKFAQRQALLHATSEIANMLLHGDDQVVDKAREKMERALRVGFGIAELGLDFFEHSHEIPYLINSSNEYNPGRRVLSPWPLVNQCLNGGLGAGQIGFFIGAPASGKSTLLCDWGAAAIEQGIPVIHFTHELNEADLALKYAARLTGLPMAEVQAETDEYKRRVAEVSRYARFLHIKFFPPGVATVGTLRAYTSKLTAMKEVTPGLIISDYVEKLAPTGQTSDNTDLTVGRLCGQLVQLASEYSCPVLTAAQFNRSGAYRSDAGSEFIGHSFRQVAIADFIACIQQDRYMKQMGRMKLYIDKVRRGTDQVEVPLTVDYARSLTYQGWQDLVQQQDVLQAKPASELSH